MNYKDYILSDEWKTKSKKWKSENNCYVCDSTIGLNVHHFEYTKLGNESLELMDVVVLCNKCHKKVHFSNKNNFFNNPKRNYERVKKMRKHYAKINNLKSGERSQVTTIKKT